MKDIDLFEITTTMLHNSDHHVMLLPGHEMQRIWGEKYQQGKLVFLSHRANYRRQVSEVKAVLETQGLSCFLAHEDVMPSLSWQNEILNALNTMDVFVGFVTDDFHHGGGLARSRNRICTQTGSPQNLRQAGTGRSRRDGRNGTGTQRRLGPCCRPHSRSSQECQRAVALPLRLSSTPAVPGIDAGPL